MITAAVSDRAGISDLVKGEVFFGSPPASRLSGHQRRRRQSLPRSEGCGKTSSSSPCRARRVIATGDKDERRPRRLRGCFSGFQSGKSRCSGVFLATPGVCRIVTGPNTSRWLQLHMLLFP